MLENLKKRIPVPIRQGIRELLIKFELMSKKGTGTVTISDTEAKFHIKNKNDIRRIKDSFEGEYSKYLVNFLEKLEKGKEVVNIGSAQGFYTIFAALTGHKVTSIEPDPSTFKLLEENISLNGVKDHVKTLNCAIGHEDKEVKLFTSGVSGPAPILENSKGFKKWIRIKMLRFDSIFTKDNLPDTIIVDIEGYEGNFLKGLGELRPKNIFVEIHPKLLKEINSSEEEVLNTFKNYGYNIEQKYERGNELHYHFVIKK